MERLGVMDMSMESLKMMEYSKAKLHDIKTCQIKHAILEDETKTMEIAKGGGTMKLERAGQSDEPLALVKRKPVPILQAKESANSVQPLQAAHTIHCKRGVESGQTLLKTIPKQGIGSDFD